MICIEDDCDRSVERRDMCFKHYMRWRRGGGIEREGRLRPRQREIRDEMLHCPDCATWKPLDAFRCDPTRTHGRAFVCNDCRNAAARAAYDAEAERERQMRKRAADPEVWTERRQRREARRRARLQAAPHEDFKRSQVWELCDGTCGICGLAVDPDDWHLDHIVPLSRGGGHLLNNAQVAHPMCNLRKNNRLPSKATA